MLGRIGVGVVFAMVWVGPKYGAAQGAGSLGERIRAMVAEAGVARAHWGVAVVGLDGVPLFGMNEGQMFQPASNAKLFTTAAAMALLGGETTFSTKVIGRGVFSGNARLSGDLVIVGGGEANLSGRAVPYVAPKDRKKGEAAADPLRALAAMADQVAATGLKVVDGDVVGEDGFGWEPYPSDWSIDDMVWGYGAPVSGLTVNDNQMEVTVRPGRAAGEAASVTVVPAVPAYYTVDASGLSTVGAKTGSHVDMERAPGGYTLRVFGTIAVDAPADVEEVAIQDPAEYAAMAFAGMLEARGVKVTGKAKAEHAPVGEGVGFLRASSEVAKRFELVHLGDAQARCVADMYPVKGEATRRVLAEHQSVPLKEDVVVTNKVSQNLHAELLLHQLGKRFECGGTRAEGAGVVRGFLVGRVGVDPEDFVFYDGSGLSGHDLVTPRATAKLLVWAAGQPWFADWKASLPVGGEDGSLAARFGKGPLAELQGKVFAKTGTLGEARALSGYLVGASGRTVVFSVMVGNHTPRTAEDRAVMDRIVGAIAAAE